MATRSKRLGATTSTTAGSSDQTLFTVLTGQTAIVKFVVVYQATTTSNNWRIGVSLAGGSGTFYFYRAGSVTSTTPVLLAPWIVLEAGDSLVYRDNVGGNAVHVSGALLTA